FLDQSVGIRATVKGMRGGNMPQIQLYFVDSCRIHPDEYAKFQNAGNPVGLPSNFNGEDTRSSVIYYAACPQTRAKGRIGRGTYFAEALIDCLDGLALQSPILNSALPIAKTHWHINVVSLITPLQDQITAIAARDGETQKIVPGGMVIPQIFCATPTPPPVT